MGRRLKKYECRASGAHHSCLTLTGAHTLAWSFYILVVVEQPF